MEFARASQKGPHLAPRIGAARLSRRVLILFSGPYARPDGLVAFLQRLGLEVVPVDNDSRSPAEETRRTTFSATISIRIFCAAPKEESS